MHATMSACSHVLARSMPFRDMKKPCPDRRGSLHLLYLKTFRGQPCRALTSSPSITLPLPRIIVMTRRTLTLAILPSPKPPCDPNALSAKSIKYQSSGRGGAGNIQRRSISSSPYPTFLLPPNSPTASFTNSNPDLNAHPGADFLSLSSSSLPRSVGNPSTSNISTAPSAGGTSGSSQSSGSLYTYIYEDQIVSTRGREPKLDPRKVGSYHSD